MRAFDDLLFTATGEFLNHLVADVKTDPSTLVRVGQTGHALESHDPRGQLLVGNYAYRMGTDSKGHGFFVRAAKFRPGRTDAHTGLPPALSGL